jgi:hypothetical protein
LRQESTLSNDQQKNKSKGKKPTEPKPKAKSSYGQNDLPRSHLEGVPTLRLHKAQKKPNPTAHNQPEEIVRKAEKPKSTSLHQTLQ